MGVLRPKARCTGHAAPSAVGEPKVGNEKVCWLVLAGAFRAAGTVQRQVSVE